MRSSWGPGVARWSVLLVVSHSEPSGAAAAVRNRPYVPTRNERFDVTDVPLSRTRHNRCPVTPPIQATLLMIAMPEGPALSVCHCALGLV